MRALILYALFAAVACSQTAYYPFSIDQDALSGPVDFGFLNHPLTPADRLFVRDGHFYCLGADLLPNTDDDRQVRLFGLNLAFSANFPAAPDATRIARRLRRLGVNLVRLHHMDSQPDSNPSNVASLLTTGPYPTLNPGSVDRLRTFLTALAAEGIYANVNLKVGYLFRPVLDGVPTMEPAIPTQSKPLHIFYPRMVDLQAEYVRKVIDGLALQDDPVLGMMEINNESSLLYEYQVTRLDSQLNGAYLTEFVRQWNCYLEARYATTDALRQAWTPAVVDGPQLLGANWTVELHGPARAILAANDQTIEVRFVQGGDTIIAKHVGFSIAAGKTYQAEVEVRADLADGVTRNIYWDVKQDTSPWRTQNGRTIAVSGQWQKYTMLFQAGFAMDQVGRFGLSVESVQANVQIRSARLYEAGERGLASTEELGSVALMKTTERSSSGRSNDFLDFLAETDRTYLGRMLAAIREKAGPLVPVAGTQIGFGGLMTIDSHRDLDYHDHHFYIDHYNFPNAAWDGRDWRIRDSSAVATGLSTILNIAASRPAGKPYTVSEFNQPWPNQQGAELIPLLAAMAAFQDWDGLMHFAYSHGRGWDDGVPNGFNLNGDWTKFINFGQAAWLYRTGAVAVGSAVLEVPVPRELRLRATSERRNGNINALLASAVGIAATAALDYRMRLVDKPLTAARAFGSNEHFHYDAAQRVFFLHAPSVAGILGFTGTENVESGLISVRLADSARGFVTVVVTPLDEKPLVESRRLLLTLPGQTLRTQPGSSEPQKLVLYPGTTDWFTLQPEPRINKPSGDMNVGSRPTFLERVECHVFLRVAAAGMTVYPLDGAGQRKPALDARFLTPADTGFRIHLQAEGQEFSPWYEIVID